MQLANDIFSIKCIFLLKKKGWKEARKKGKKEGGKKGKKPSVYWSMVKDSPVDMTPKSLLYSSKGQA